MFSGNSFMFKLLGHHFRAIFLYKFFIFACICRSFEIVWHILDDENISIALYGVIKESLNDFI